MKGKCVRSRANRTTEHLEQIVSLYGQSPTHINSKAHATHNRKTKININRNGEKKRAGERERKEIRSSIDHFDGDIGWTCNRIETTSHSTEFIGIKILNPATAIQTEMASRWKCLAREKCLNRYHR